MKMEGLRGLLVKMAGEGGMETGDSATAASTRCSR